MTGRSHHLHVIVGEHTDAVLRRMAKARTGTVGAAVERCVRLAENVDEATELGAKVILRHPDGHETEVVLL